MDHDALWNSSFPELQSAQEAVTGQLRKLAESANVSRAPSEWDELFEKKVVRPVIFMGQSLVTLPTATGSLIPTPVKVFMVYEAEGTVDPVGLALASAMNDQMQVIIQGVPGAAGHFPK